MTWLWIPHASSWSSTYECVGLLRTSHPLLTSRFTFQHLPAFVFCLFCVVVWFCCFGVFLFPVFALLCFWFLFCKCLGIPNSPRSLDLDDRQGLIARSAMQPKKKKHAWPQPHQLRSLQVTRVSAQAFEAARVSSAVKHLWPGLRPQWTTIYSTLRLEWPGVYDPSVLHGKFFDNVGQSDHTQDSQYQGKHWWWVFQRFRANQGVMAQRLTISEPWGFGSWQANMVEFENTLRLERAELDSCEETRKANHQYRTPHGTYRIKRTQ